MVQLASMRLCSGLMSSGPNQNPMPSLRAVRYGEPVQMCRERSRRVCETPY
jgi:hypothetical protein